MEAVRLQLRAVPASVTEARHAIDKFAERLDCDHGAVRIAVSEAVGNSAMHAYRDGEPGPVVVLARVLRERLVITVADSGGGVRPHLESPGLGLGLPIVGQVADDVRIESDDRGTAISISFAIGGAPERPQAAREASADAIEAELERARALVRARGRRTTYLRAPAFA